MRSTEEDFAVGVVIVAKKDARTVKEWLKSNERLSPSFRLCASAEVPDCISIPIVGDEALHYPEHGVILGRGRQVCPHKSSEFGNRSNYKTSCSLEICSVASKRNFNRIQAVLLHTITSPSIAERIDIGITDQQVIDSIGKLDELVCPTKLQFFGDDRTLVLSQAALNHSQQESFSTFLVDVGVVGSMQEEVMAVVFETLASCCNSPRIVRKGPVDAESAIRESTFTLLWPRHSHGAVGNSRPGTNSLEWITITENGIRQSFNLLRVMFSRGNVNEKFRFGNSLVQPGDMVLDMYAGIGYFTLPALIHGKAQHVVACEWNEQAVKALRFNLADNNVQDRATVYVGDCRVVAKESNLVDMFDRVSLGLLPSSEGGWPTAVRALKEDCGGWLHVHANAPAKESGLWFTWLCTSLLRIAREDGRLSWSVIGCHLEKVKSFAPMVNHYVADVWLGPASTPPMSEWKIEAGVAATVRRRDGPMAARLHIIQDAEVAVPSCALSDDGVLHHAWMR